MGRSTFLEVAYLADGPQWAREIHLERPLALEAAARIAAMPGMRQVHLNRYQQAGLYSVDADGLPSPVFQRKTLRSWWGEGR
jgi:hypothetical protein